MILAKVYFNFAQLILIEEQSPEVLEKAIGFLEKCEKHSDPLPDLTQAARNKKKECENLLESLSKI